MSQSGPDGLWCLALPPALLSLLKQVPHPGTRASQGREAHSMKEVSVAVPGLSFAHRRCGGKYSLLQLQCFHSEAQKTPIHYLDCIFTCTKNVLQGIFHIWLRRCEPGRMEEEQQTGGRSAELVEHCSYSVHPGN